MGLVRDIINEWNELIEMSSKTKYEYNMKWEK